MFYLERESKQYGMINLFKQIKDWNSFSVNVWFTDALIGVPRDAFYTVDKCCCKHKISVPRNMECNVKRKDCK